MKNKTKIVVTGGAGFIGSHLAEALLACGYNVHVVDNLSSGRKENISSGAVFHQVDICNLQDLKKIFKEAETVFHLAAMPIVDFSIKEPVLSNEVNMLGTLNVLEAARICGATRVVFSSSCAVYGDVKRMPISEDVEARPISPYGLQKYVSEEYCRLYSRIYGLETVCLRYFNVYGSGQSAEGSYASVVPKFIELKKLNEPLTITGSGKQTRDFVYIKDVVEANIRAMKTKKANAVGEAINIGSGEETSINELAQIIGGKRRYIKKRLEIERIFSDNTKASSVLGWVPKHKLKDGILNLICEK